MKKIFKSGFVLLGGRPYVQGSLIAYGLIDAVKCWGLGEISRFNLESHVMLYGQGSFELIEGSFSNKSEYCSVAKVWLASGETMQVGLRPIAGDIASVPYDEESLIADYSIVLASKSISMGVFSKEHFLGVIIALYKKLLSIVFPKNTLYSKWIFIRFDISWEKVVNSSAKSISIVHLITLGNRHCKAEVLLGCEVVGYVYFSRKEI